MDKVTADFSTIVCAAESDPDENTHTFEVKMYVPVPSRLCNMFIAGVLDGESTCKRDAGRAYTDRYVVQVRVREEADGDSDRDLMAARDKATSELIAHVRAAVDSVNSFIEREARASEIAQGINLVPKD